METIHQQIIAFLQNRQQATTAELSHSLMVTRADVRYHLNQMEQMGIVEKHLPSEMPEKGRPAYLYLLSNRVLPENYQGLARALLEISTRVDPTLNIAELMAKAVMESTSSSRRGNILGDLTHRLNQLGYQARWEAASQGPRIILRNCPYSSLVKDFPVLCQMDRQILESVVKAPFVQTAKTSRAGGQARQCVFKASSSL